MSVITAEGRKIRKAILWAAGLVVGLNVLAFLFSRFHKTEVVDGPSGSSFVTTSQGVAAWRALLEAQGLRTETLDEPYLPYNLDPSKTLVIVEPFVLTVSASESDVIRDYVAAGGRLVIVGSVLDAFLQDVLDDPPTWFGTSIGESSAESDDPLMIGVETLQGRGFGRYDRSPSYRTLAAGDDGSTVVAGEEGRVVLVANAGFVNNGSIDRADNPILAVNLAGGRTVVFDEHFRAAGGLGEPSSALGRLPGNWATFVQLGAVALVVWLFAYGRRFAPHQLVSRPFPPPRSQYVDSVAANLARTRQPSSATSRLAAAARKEITRKSPPGFELAQAAASLGLDEKEIAVVAGGGQDDQALVAAASALAKLKETR